MLNTFLDSSDPIGHPFQFSNHFFILQQIRFLYKFFPFKSSNFQNIYKLVD